MKYLILTSDDNEIFYNLDIIVNISFGLAVNLLNESDMQKNGYKPLETVMGIYFTDGRLKFPVFRLRMRAGMSVPPISCVTCTSNSVGAEA